MELKKNYYKNGKPHGIWIYYDEYGNLMKNKKENRIKNRIILIEDY